MNIPISVLTHISLVSIVIYLLYPRLRRVVSQWRERWKESRSIQWRPESPHDCHPCCAGVTLSVVKHADVLPYSQIKSPPLRSMRWLDMAINAVASDSSVRPVAKSSPLLYGQLVKRKKRKRFAITRMLCGTRANLRDTLRQPGFSGRIHTAYIERVNLTFRQGIAALSRSTGSYAYSVESLRLHAEWFRLYYHMVRPHQSLQVQLAGTHQRYRA